MRAYAIEDRTGRRIDDAIERHRSAATRAQGLVALTFSTGEVVAGVANAAVVVVGVKLGIDGELTLGELLAFLFLVTLFVGPVQIGTEVLNEAQNAIAGWRRVLGVLDTPADVADPGPAGKTLPRGPIDVRFEHVSFAYPGGPTVLDDVDVALTPAVPGRGRRRDRLGQDDVRQAAHPADGSGRGPGARRRRRPAGAVRSSRCGHGS